MSEERMGRYKALVLCSLAAVCISCGSESSDNGKGNENDSQTCTAPAVSCNGSCVTLADRHWRECGVCAAGYEDKDKNAENGCEYKTVQTDVAEKCADDLVQCGDNCVDFDKLHWVGCNRCATVWEDADGDPDNGCEAPVAHEETGCTKPQVKCGDDCVNLSERHWKSCDVCVDDYEDADGNAENGCESKKPLVCSDPLVNCNETCVDLSARNWSACNTCVAGFEDKDGNAENGCESVISECPAGQVICAGGCTDLSQKNWAACDTCLPGYSESADGCVPAAAEGCEDGQVKCDETCQNLAANHWVSCGVCMPGFEDADSDPANGCEALKCADGFTLCGDACVDMAQKHWRSCGECRPAYEDTDGDDANGCETRTMPIGACHEDADCASLAHVTAASCKAGNCVIAGCADGYADCDDDSATGCEVNAAQDYYHCGAKGLCTSSDASGADYKGIQCSLGEQCIGSACRPVPEIIGCSDGTREGFLDLIRFNNLAACGGAWQIRGIHHNEGPACSRQSGNTGTNRDGVGCNLEDLCAEGWHVCLGRGDVMTRSDYGCNGIMDGVNPNEPVLFITRTSSTGSLNCDPDTVGVPLNMNDIFGCGNFGCYATGNDCDPLKLSSHNLCSALRNDCGCSKQGDGSVKCGSYSPGDACYGGEYGHSLGYFAALNGKTYAPAWDCSSDKPDSPNGWQEARDILKSLPDQQGGVMCCKDQCQADADCGVGLLCRFHVCVECIRNEDGTYEGCPDGKRCSQQHTCI